MSAHSALKGSRLRRGLVTVTGLALAGAFIALGGAATAAPGPTADQVRQKINKLMSQLDRVDQQYDQSMVQLSTATTRLNMINRRLSQAQHSFEAMRLAITQIASAAYEQGDLNSTIAMLGTDNPQVVLDRADLLSHLSSDRRAQMSAFITAAKTLRDSQQQQRRTKAAIAQLEKQKAAQKAHLQHLVAKNRAELRKLTTPAPSFSTHCPRSAIRMCMAPAGRVASTARGSSWLLGRPLGFRSPVQPMNSGQPFRMWRVQASSLETCCSMTPRATWPSMSGTAISWTLRSLA